MTAMTTMTNKSNAKTRAIFMGTPAFAATALNAIASMDHIELVGVYSQPPRPAKRGKKMQISEVHQTAQALGLPIFTPQTFQADEDIAQFTALKADVAVVAAYGLLLPTALLTAPRFGCVNIHASLLPRWRGAAPIHRAIEAGDRQTGVCLMQMDAGLDTGDVIARQEVPIGADCTTPMLHDTLASLGATMIATLLTDHRDGQWPRTPQGQDAVTYARKIDKVEARLDWQQPAEHLARQVRAFTPFPGAFFELPDGQGRIKVLKAHVAPSAPQSTATNTAPSVASSVAPGTVLKAFDIQTARGVLSIATAQRAGKTAMSADELLRGLSLTPGTVLS